MWGLKWPAAAEIWTLKREGGGGLRLRTAGLGWGFDFQVMVIPRIRVSRLDFTRGRKAASNLLTPQINHTCALDIHSQPSSFC